MCVCVCVCVFVCVCVDVSGCCWLPFVFLLETSTPYMTSVSPYANNYKSIKSCVFNTLYCLGERHSFSTIFQVGQTIPTKRNEGHKLYLFFERRNAKWHGTSAIMLW